MGKQVIKEISIKVLSDKTCRTEARDCSALDVAKLIEVILKDLIMGDHMGITDNAKFYALALVNEAILDMMDEIGTRTENDGIKMFVDVLRDAMEQAAKEAEENMIYDDMLGANDLAA